jgi:galactokinase
LEQLSKHIAEFDPDVYVRCKFLVEENTRISECCEMLKQNDMTGFGQNMYKSHEGLRLAYDMNCREVNFLMEKIRISGLSIGSKLMAYRGSIISIVNVEKVDAFIKLAGEAFTAEYGHQLKTYTLKIDNGTGKL